MQRSFHAPATRRILSSQWICSQCAKQIRQASSAAFVSPTLSNASNSLRGRWVRPSQSVNGQNQQGVIVQQRRWIGRNYLKNLVGAEEDWQKRAKEIAAGDKKSVLDVLEERGFVNQIVGTREQFKKLIDNRRVGVYCGVDPTAPSMHVGHMVPFMALSWMYIHGYSVTFLLGGATSRIGDPEGRLKAREEVSRTKRSANVAMMHTQLKRFGELMERYAGRRGYEREWAWRRGLINNSEWHSTLPWSDLIRDMGQYVRIGPMLGRDSVKNRLEHGDGMSFAEFSYPLIQAWDWWHMFQKGVQVQIGGADQFGNILQGAEAVKLAAKNDAEWLQRMDQELKSSQERSKVEVSEEPMGFTVPLLTTASGEKFGKSAGNAVWLDASMTSVFELYAFWLKTADVDVEKYLKLFTYLPLEEISTIMAEHQKDESKRVAQHKLASEFTELIHGVGAAEEASRQHRALFNKNTSLDDILQFAKQQDSQTQTQATVDGHPSVTKNAKPQSIEKYSTTQAELPRSAVMEKPLSRVLWSAGLAASRSEAQRLINNKGAYIGANPNAKGQMSDSLTYTAIQDPNWEWWKGYIIDDNLLILRTGKWRVKVINIISDEEFAAKGLSCPGFGAEESSPPSTEISQPNRNNAYARKTPDIPVEEDVEGRGGWDEISRLRLNKRTKKMVDAGKPESNEKRTHREPIVAHWMGRGAQKNKDLSRFDASRRETRTRK